MVRSTLAVSAVAVALCACGGGDDVDEGDSEVTCALGATLTGDVEKRISAEEDAAACLVSHSFDSGLFVSFAPDFSGMSVAIDIASVIEAQTGSGFPTEIAVTSEDDRRYSTSMSGCSSTIIEHELETTRTGELGEERSYRVIGTASCTEPALPVDGASGQVSIAGVSFVFSAVWRD